MLIINYIKMMWARIASVFILSVLFLFVIFKVMGDYNQYVFEYDVDFSKLKEINAPIRYNFVGSDHGMITYNHILKNALSYNFLANYNKVVEKYDIPVGYYNFKINTVDKSINFVSHSDYETVVGFSKELNELIYDYYKSEYEQLIRKTISYKRVLLEKAENDIKLLEKKSMETQKQISNIHLLQFDIQKLRSVRRVLASDSVELWNVEVDIKKTKLEKHKLIAIFSFFLIQIIFIALSFIKFRENHED
ncbi:hypothetical protein [Vibrio sp. 1S139]|uniref:hypothetical protein n=1 Tax=Vibrio sp. 1S139 TaxID=3230006 RepID=UPI00352C01F9